MKPRVAVAALLAAILAAGSALGACPPAAQKAKSHAAKSHAAKRTAAKTRAADGCIDLNAVPQISDGIVAGEPLRPSAKKAYTPPVARPYEGPTLGLSKPEPGSRPGPTVGYRWSLE